MTALDFDRLDAAIAAAPGPVIALPRAQLEVLARAARIGMAARAQIAGQARMDAAIAELGRAD